MSSCGNDRKTSLSRKNITFSTQLPKRKIPRLVKTSIPGLTDPQNDQGSRGPGMGNPKIKVDLARLFKSYTSGFNRHQ